MQDQYNLSVIQELGTIYSKNISSVKKINLNNIIEYTHNQFKIIDNSDYCKCGIPLLNDKNKYNLKPKAGKLCYRCGLMKRKNLDVQELRHFLVQKSIKSTIRGCECGRFYKRNGSGYCLGCYITNKKILKELKKKTKMRFN